MRVSATIGLGLLGVTLLTVTTCSGAGNKTGVDELPADFKQIVPRGRIVSLDEPEFVPAADADLSDDAWVLGVKVGGVAKAYSLNLLNRHEIVNDRFGELPVAAVW